MAKVQGIYCTKRIEKETLGEFKMQTECAILLTFAIAALSQRKVPAVHYQVRVAGTI